MRPTATIFSWPVPSRCLLNMGKFMLICQDLEPKHWPLMTGCLLNRGGHWHRFYCTRRAIIVTPAVRVRVTLPVWSTLVVHVRVALRQSFMYKFFGSSYLGNLSNIHIWTIVALESRLSFHDSLPRVHAPGWGWRSKSRAPLNCDFLHSCYANNLQRYLVRHQSTLWHWLLCHEVKVIITYISRSSGFALYLEGSLMCEAIFSSPVWVQGELL